MGNYTTKQCSLCHQAKSRLEFLRSWFMEDGLDTVCYQCRTGRHGQPGFHHDTGTQKFKRSRAGQRALAYWNYRCAICGRMPDEFFTLAIDHWYPYSYTGSHDVTNMLPMCHTRRKGQGSGCNSNKRNQNPVLWLYDRLGEKSAAGKLQQINAYFEWAANQINTSPEVIFRW